MTRVPWSFFLAIQELEIVCVLMVCKFSKITIQDPSKTKSAHQTRLGNPIPTGIISTSRNAEQRNFETRIA